MKKLSIIIPAYNEAPTIGQLVEKILAVKFNVEYEVIIVDDHSHDRTNEIVTALGRESVGRVKVFRNETNQGKGYSIQKGFSEASGDLAIVQDADFEYDPNDIPRLVEPILKGETDVVFGSRFLTRSHPLGMAYPNLFANRLLTSITNLFYGTRFTDVYSCYKVIPLQMLRSFQLSIKGFESEAEILGKLLRNKNTRVGEVPIAYEGRTVKQGKKIKTRDFFLAVQVLFLYRRRTP